MLVLFFSDVHTGNVNAKQVTVSDGVQLAEAMMDPAVEECVLTNCAQYTMSQALFPNARTLQPSAVLTVRVAQQLGCRPLLDFNYTTGKEFDCSTHGTHFFTI